MDIAELSTVMSQSSVKQSAGVQLAKMMMNAEKESAAQMTEVLKNVTVDPNLGNNLDARV
ncbi:hypothetical protein CBE01nite_23440 [Clostridium beijerinckii]|uniref:YjfB family protein n=1 Tax=Clostridium beijerinckii TaxID=1520 RepID=A0AB74VDN4_CLOBE|nr:YjfB family protein [Clostridium beijerinckii]NRZ28834.1 hypothetical protein [Clostridium beijerinckii]NYB95392.1 hypothetical protein [Clostridium beijerinckii]OOM26904.1 hypothetical protein CLBEI_08490 [Clostridium beijerinckii]QUN34506.1 YjfB family protein [Clostridium beijerinckii]SQB00536.1 putative motility protein [Clostridium beijerinckii]